MCVSACIVATCLLLVFPHLLLAQQNGDVRLVNGGTCRGSNNIGRVEVYYDGEWGTVCDDNWGLADADVVCRQLGFEGACRVIYRAQCGRGKKKPIWLDQLSCRGREASILGCRHNGWGIHDCSHREDAGVNCCRPPPKKPPNMPVRLSCPRYTAGGSCRTCPRKRYPDPDDCLPQTAVEGIVEVQYEGNWRPVSATGWDLENARVVCGELGYPVALATPKLRVIWPDWNGSCIASTAGSGSGDEFNLSQCDPLRERLQSTFLQQVDCSGNERRLLDCYFSDFGPHANPYASLRVATVRCGFLPHQSCNSTQGNIEKYRLRGGAVPWIGRVEVYRNGEWGTVCDIGWDVRDGNVVCRALGYGTANVVRHRASFGRGVDPIHYSQLRCKGNELYLSNCNPMTGIVIESCGHRGDAGVICNVPPQCEEPLARLVDVPDPNPAYRGTNNTFVEVKGFSGWGLLCYGSLDFKTAQVMCRENREIFVARIRSGTHRDYRGRSYIGSIQCNGDEMAMRECTMLMALVLQCRSGHAIVDCTSALPDLVPDLGALQRSLRSSPYVDRVPMYYLTCALEENCLAASARGQNTNSYRHLLRFTSQTMNWGTMDFLPNLRPEEWIWHSCHNHYHSFEAFMQYDILNVTTGVKVAEGHKASFCLEDSLCGTGGSPRYRCGFRSNQGISANCGDVYGSYLDCQWIDITDVSPGTYILRLHVNPTGAVSETDYRNNAVQCTIDYYPGFYINSHSCKHSDH